MNPLKSNTEILDKHGYNKSLIGSGFHENLILPAMDEARKETGIAFAEWMDYNAVRNCENKWTCRIDNWTTVYTTEHLYEIYIKEQQNR